MPSQSIHVRPNSERVALLDAIRSKERTGPSRNAMATILLEDAIDREAERLNLHAWTEPKAPARPVPLHNIYGEHVIGHGHVIASAPTESPPQRFERLRSAAKLSQQALCVQLGISRGALQRAMRKGEVPPEVEAWMREREGGR